VVVAAEAADPHGGVDPDQALAVGAGEALRDQLGSHEAEAVVAADTWRPVLEWEDRPPRMEG
jgi:hypothetical protein